MDYDSFDLGNLTFGVCDHRNGRDGVLADFCLRNSGFCHCAFGVEFHLGKQTAYFDFGLRFGLEHPFGGAYFAAFTWEFLDDLSFGYSGAVDYFDCFRDSQKTIKYQKAAVHAAFCELYKSESRQKPALVFCFCIVERLSP